MPDEKLPGTLPANLTESEASPTSVAEVQTPVATLAELDLRTYELIEPLGEGGMGEVYRCCDPALSRDLAIKVMKADLHDHPQVERRFLREARVTGSLQHPGIVAVHNLGRLADGRLHYTMRLVRGRTLADILKEEAGKPDRLPSLLAIFEKVCEAVAYAHSKRVIHRDLKPANIMVGKFGEVQVMDWGLAKLLTPEGEPIDERPQPEPGSTLIHTEPTDTPLDLTRAGTGIGTPAYMPPEQAQGDWELVDERADVFALGAMLCVILTGKPPYHGKDGNDILRRARLGDLADALARLEKCGADAALTELCRECLSVERQQRPRGAGMVALRVADYQAEVEARLRQAELERTEAEVKSREERKRRRLTLSLSAAVLLVFVAGTLISTLFAIDAHQQADAARKHAEDAENEKLRADAEKQLALQARDDEELALIEGLLLPIGRAIGALSETEVDAFTLLYGLRSDHTRLRFIEEGLRMPERAQRLALRAEWVIQAVIGLDGGRRQRAKEVLMRRLRQREAPQEVQTACVMLGIALDIQDPLLDERAGK
jgi:serine/threonine protein kinase